MGVAPKMTQTEASLKKVIKNLNRKLYVSTEYINLKYRAVFLPLSFTVDLHRRVRFREYYFKLQNGCHNIFLGQSTPVAIFHLI